MKQYADLASIYDKMIDVDYDAWIKFIDGYFFDKGISLKGKYALELGCGTGNMTLRLKSRGMELTAIDISEDMLNLAQQKALEKRVKINFVSQDMIDFEMNRKFDFIFSFCDGYNYITEEEDLLSSFNRVYSHLNVGGRFIFDISTEYKLRDAIGNSTFTMNEDRVCYIWDNYLEGDILEMYITFFVQEGKLYRRVDETHVQKAHKNQYLVQLLKGSGFSKVEIFNDYSFEALTNESMRATFIAEK